MYSVREGQSFTSAGFPHSEISGSQVVCTSPELIAAYHVLHRLLTPRHPPSALSSLTEQKVLDHSTIHALPALGLDGESPSSRYAVVKEQLCQGPALVRGAAETQDPNWWRLPGSNR